MVAVNDVKFTGHPIPFGGMKASGLGREGGIEGFEAFVETTLRGTGLLTAPLGFAAASWHGLVRVVCLANDARLLLHQCRCPGLARSGGANEDRSSDILGSNRRELQICSRW
jgi:hypothetical protein